MIIIGPLLVKTRSQLQLLLVQNQNMESCTNPKQSRQLQQNVPLRLRLIHLLFLLSVLVGQRPPRSISDLPFPHASRGKRAQKMYLSVRRWS
jgi:hypothetical protein